jgi:hypothetical protein
MSEKDELKQELEKELQWVTYRDNILKIIKEKLMEMMELAEQARVGKLSTEEIETVNVKLDKLTAQVKALDEESRIAN